MAVSVTSLVVKPPWWTSHQSSNGHPHPGHLFLWVWPSRNHSWMQKPLVYGFCILKGFGLLCTCLLTSSSVWEYAVHDWLLLLTNVTVDVCFTFLFSLEIKAYNITTFYLQEPSSSSPASWLHLWWVCLYPFASLLSPVWIIGRASYLFVLLTVYAGMCSESYVDWILWHALLQSIIGFSVQISTIWTYDHIRQHDTEAVWEINHDHWRTLAKLSAPSFPCQSTSPSWMYAP